MWPQSTQARLRLIMAVGAVALVGWLVWSARSALYPFVVGAIFAYVLAPLVDRVASALRFHRTRPNLAIGLAVAYVYAMALLALVIIASLVVPRIGDQAGQLASSVPSLVDTARARFEAGSSWYRERVPENIQAIIDQRTQELAQRTGDIAVGIVERTISIVTGGVSNVLSYVVVPFWLFYVLKDRRQAADAFYGLFPASMRPDVKAMAHRANEVLGSYIRAQLLLATVTGVVTWVGLMLFGIQFSLILGLIAAVANLIPVIGPMIGGIPAIVVTAATRPGWTVLWVFLFLFISQNLKDYILVPRIQGQAVHLHPAVILMLLVIAGHLAGFWGLLIAVPVTAVLRDIFVYVYGRLSEGDRPCPDEGDGARGDGSTVRVVHEVAPPPNAEHGGRAAHECR